MTSPASSWSTCTTSSSRPETSSRSVTPPLPDGLRGDGSCCCVPTSFVQARRTGWYWSPIAAVSTYVRMYCMLVIGTDRVLTCDLHGAARSCGCFLHAVLLCLPPNKMYARAPPPSPSPYASYISGFEGVFFDSLVLVTS